MNKNTLPDFLKNSLTKVWEGFLKNLGVLIAAFILSGGYLIALTKIKEFQTWVRSIPTDYILTPFVLLIIAIAVLVHITYKQQKKISTLTREPAKDEKNSRFVTHLGVWWKIYPDAEYIEDFPYCPCCEPKIKLAQIEWHPDEQFKCPKTATEYKLYDKIPREREEVLQRLYRSYFEGFGSRFNREFFLERNRLKQLYPEMSEEELGRKLFELKPFCLIPDNERDDILKRFPNPVDAFHFVERHISKYKKYFRKDEET
jgi:hypothetical protein